mmetsp:Transcript_93288/g.213254  ORF Transcript_93288/g.213254 Transcript_93288/m.213254 type:complete len:253 (-) Transcript_93288:466-1224(-)
MDPKLIRKSAIRLALHQLLEHLLHHLHGQHVPQVQVSDERHVGQQPVLLANHLGAEPVLVVLELDLLLLRGSHGPGQSLIFLLDSIQQDPLEILGLVPLVLSRKLGVLLVQRHDHPRVGGRVVPSLQGVLADEVSHLNHLVLGLDVNVGHLPHHFIQVLRGDLVQESSHVALELRLARQLLGLHTLPRVLRRLRQRNGGASHAGASATASVAASAASPVVSGVAVQLLCAKHCAVRWSAGIPTGCTTRRRGG